MTVLVVGESLVDVTIRAGAEPSTRPGGSPLNIAVGCARLDMATVLATQFGDDDFGELVRDHLDVADVDVRSLPPHHADTSVARAYLDVSGQARYEFALSWDPSELPAPSGMDCVHIGSIAAALQPGADSVRTLAQQAHREGVPISLDPNVRTTITPDVAFLRERFRELAGLATVVKLSDEDAAVLFPADEDVLESLVAGGATLAVMTYGGESIQLRSRGASVTITPPTVAVADTIGAGDSFMSALLTMLVERELHVREDLSAAELEELGTYAARAAAITCTRHGADPPTRAELEADA